MSACGQVQLVDTIDVDNAKLDIFQLDTQGRLSYIINIFYFLLTYLGGMALSMDTSLSNQCLAFGDENSGISVFSKAGFDQPVFNICPRYASSHFYLKP